MPTRLRALVGDVRAQLLAVALVGLGVRLVAIFRWSTGFELQGDQAFYNHQAIDLTDWVGFTYRHPVGEQVTTAVHPPLHSSWLGLWSLLGLDSPDAHRVAGAVLGMLTVLVAGLAARRLAGDRAAVLAALVVAVAPTLWINDALVLSESSYAFGIALVLWAAVELIGSPGRWRALALGAAVALAALSRAEALGLVVLLVVPLVVLAVAGGDGGAWRRRAALAGWAALGLVVVAGPWIGRNLTAFENPAVMSTGGGFVLEIASCDRTFYGDRLGYWAPECDRTPWAAGDETATEAVKREAALDYLSENTDRLPTVVAARVGRMWDVWRPSESVFFNDFYEQRGRDTSWWAIRAWWSMLAVGAVGAWALRRRPVTLVPFAAIALTTTAAAAVSFGITRYRTGLEVAIAVLAGIGLARLLAALRSRRPVEAVGDGTADGAGTPVGAAS